MSGETLVRLATPADAVAISAVLYASFLEFRPQYTPESFAATAIPTEQVWRRMEEGPLWVAASGAKLVGTVAGVPKEKSFYLRGMGVIPSARSAGVASHLLRTAEGEAKARGYPQMSLCTTTFLGPAIRLYERFGFQPEGEVYDWLGVPLIDMLKMLK